MSFGAHGRFTQREQSDPAMATKLLAAGADPNMRHHVRRDGRSWWLQPWQRRDRACALDVAAQSPMRRKIWADKTAMMWAISKRQSAVDRLSSSSTAADVELAQ